MVLKEAPKAIDPLDLREVRAIREVRIAEANRLLRKGWILASIQPVSLWVTGNREKGINQHIRRTVCYVMVSAREEDALENDQGE